MATDFNDKVGKPDQGEGNFSVYHDDSQNQFNGGYK